MSLTPNTMLNNAVEQTLTPTIDYALWASCKAFKRIGMDSSSVDFSPVYGQGWLIRRIISSGQAGAFQWGPMNTSSTNLIASDGTNTNFNILGASTQDTWPSADITTTPAYFQWTASLVKAKGQIIINAEMTRTAELTAAKMDIFADTIKSAAEKVANHVCSAFFCETVDNITTSSGYTATLEGCVLAEITYTSSLSVAAYTADSARVLLSGSIARFRDSMECDLLIADASTDTLIRVNAAATPVFVSIVDGLANTVLLLNGSGSTISHTFGTGDRMFLVPHRALDNQGWSATTAGATLTLAASTTYYPQMPFNIERIYKASGTIMGTGTTSITSGISLSQFPRHRSYVQAASGPLDERSLFDWCARLERARGIEYSPDEFWTTEGVLSGLTDNLDGYYTWSRNGEDVKMNLGFEDTISFSAFGKKFSILGERYVGIGKLYGMVTRNRNWKRHVPPRLPGSTNGRGFDRGIEFIVPLVNPGTSDIWQGAKSSTGQTTDQLECPFWLPYNIIPDMFCGMKITGLQESIGAVG